ncbi:hypothetical protein HOY82DRAFT_603734 [Tuber indicum]|nr:hypothetical protein HOY82DRAFT_603734 [Tuber indicum]
MTFTKNLTFILLLIMTSPLLTFGTPVPDSSPTPELSPTDLAELSLINQKSLEVTIPVYKLSEDGLTAELLNETTSAGRMVCETTSGSPYVWDIERAVESLQTDDWCHQSNPGGSRCTTYTRRGTAALSVCGSWLVAVRCHELAWVGSLIATHCRWNNQAGGQYFYDGRGHGWLKGIVHWNDQ